MTWDDVARRVAAALGTANIAGGVLLHKAAIRAARVIGRLMRSTEP